MNFKAALRTDRMCKALTGLTVREFENLVLDFTWNYNEYEAKRKPVRVRKLGGGRESYLEEIEEKLFYVLTDRYYLMKILRNKYYHFKKKRKLLNKSRKHRPNERMSGWNYHRRPLILLAMHD